MSTFDLAALAATGHADVTDHVHLLRVTATWFCPSEARPAPNCEGHDTPIEGGDVELEYELEHPDTCPVPACCCTWPEGPSSIDPNCEGGLHDACLNLERCWTSRELSSWGLETFHVPQTTGVYRIQAWGSTDYWGEHDGGIEFEPVTEGATA